MISINFFYTVDGPEYPQACKQKQQQALNLNNFNNKVLNTPVAHDGNGTNLNTSMSKSENGYTTWSKLRQSNSALRLVYFRTKKFSYKYFFKCCYNFFYKTYYKKRTPVPYLNFIACLACTDYKYMNIHDFAIKFAIISCFIPSLNTTVKKATNTTAITRPVVSTRCPK